LSMSRSASLPGAVVNLMGPQHVEAVFNPGNATSRPAAALVTQVACHETRVTDASCDRNKKITATL
jgi:hypothetical protein